MKFIFSPKRKDFENEQDLVYESDLPLKQDGINWYAIDKERIRKSVPKSAYTIRYSK